MAKTEEKKFEASPARVFNACRVATAQLSYTLISADETGRMIAFNTGRSMKSFAGQDLQATVLDDGDGSRVIVGGAIARRGGMGSGQQIAWGEKAALSKKFLAEVEKVLPSLPEVVPSNSNPSESTSIAEELKSLKDLHDQGVLSEEEFSRAKDNRKYEIVHVLACERWLKRGLRSRHWLRMRLSTQLGNMGLP